MKFSHNTTRTFLLEVRDFKYAVYKFSMGHVGKALLIHMSEPSVPKVDGFKRNLLFVGSG